MSALHFDPEETTHWEQTRPSHIAPRSGRGSRLFREIFEGRSHDLDTAGTRATRPATCGRSSTPPRATRATPSC